MQSQLPIVSVSSQIQELARTNDYYKMRCSAVPHIAINWLATSNEIISSLKLPTQTSRSTPFFDSGMCTSLPVAEGFPFCHPHIE